MDDHYKGRRAMGKLDLLEYKLDLLQQKLDKALGEAEPSKLIHKEDGLFSPGSGHIPSEPEPRPVKAGPEFTQAALIRSRDILHPQLQEINEMGVDNGPTPRI